jgi:hypothetical protein
MKRTSFFLAICLITLLVGCSKDEKDESVLIRIKNVSTYDFASIQLNNNN